MGRQAEGEYGALPSSQHSTRSRSNFSDAMLAPWPLPLLLAFLALVGVLLIDHTSTHQHFTATKINIRNYATEAVAVTTERVRGVWERAGLDQPAPQYQRVPRQFWRAEELGVTHYTIPGNLPSGRRTVPVVLHIFLRVIPEQGRVRVRGYGFLDQVDVVNWGWQGVQLFQPKELSQWSTSGARITLKSVMTGETFDFNLETEPAVEDSVRPFHLETVLSSDVIAKHGRIFQMLVDDWLRFVQMSLDDAVHSADWLAEAKPKPGQETVDQTNVLKVYNVLKPIYGVTPPIAARSLAYHVRYHKALGFAGHIVYCRRDAVFEYFLQDAKILRLIESGDLRLVFWTTPIASYESPDNIHHYTTFDQPLVNQHAITAHVGTSTYLAFMDLDEYVASFKPDQFIDNLINSMRWPALVALQQINLIVQPDFCANKTNEEVGERATWLDGNYTDALAEHPLAHYGYINRPFRMRMHRKSIIDPNRVAFFSIHEGYPLRTPDFGERNLTRSVEESFGLGFEFLHLINMYRCRETADPNGPFWNDEKYQDSAFRQQDEWKWVFSLT